MLTTVVTTVLQLLLFIFQPTDGLLPESDKYTMIAYKESDLLHQDSLFKDYLKTAGIRPNVPSSSATGTYNQEETSVNGSFTLPLDDFSHGQ